MCSLKNAENWVGRVKDQTTIGGKAGQKKDATILNTGIVCSRTISASDVRGLCNDREFQRPPSFQPYIGNVAGELPRTLTISQGRKLTIFRDGENSKNFQQNSLVHIWLQSMRKHSKTILYNSAQRFSSSGHLNFGPICCLSNLQK